MVAKKTSIAKTGRDDAAPAKPAPGKSASGKQAPAKQAPAKQAAAKKAVGTKAARTSGGSGRASTSRSTKLAVRSGEKPWTARQVSVVKAALESDAARLQSETAAADEEIAALMREGGEGAGHDQADVGSNTFERDHEMTLARNARENLELVQEALGRIDNGTYGVCESCGKAIGKARLQAFPRATLCMECKQKQERR